MRLESYLQMNSAAKNRVSIFSCPEQYKSTCSDLAAYRIRIWWIRL